MVAAKLLEDSGVGLPADVVGVDVLVVPGDDVPPVVLRNPMPATVVGNVNGIVDEDAVADEDAIPSADAERADAVPSVNADIPDVPVSLRAAASAVVASDNLFRESLVKVIAGAVAALPDDLVVLVLLGVICELTPTTMTETVERALRLQDSDSVYELTPKTETTLLPQVSPGLSFSKTDR